MFNVDVDQIAEQLAEGGIDMSDKVDLTEVPVKSKVSEVKVEVDEEKKEDDDNDEGKDEENNDNEDSDDEEEKKVDNKKKEGEDDATAKRIRELEKTVNKLKEDNLKLKKGETEEEKQERYNKFIAENDYESLVEAIKNDLIDQAELVDSEEELEQLKAKNIIEGGFDLLGEKGAKVTKEFKSEIATIIEEFDLKIEESKDFEKAYKIWLKDHPEGNSEKKDDKIKNATTLDGKKATGSSSKGKGPKISGTESWDSIREKLMGVY